MILLLLAFAFTSGTLLSQNVTGRITDDTDLPLAGASVQVKNTMRGTFSDTNGNYSIAASPEDTLVFSMVGMIIQNVPVSGRSSINIKLVTETTRLEEVTGPAFCGTFYVKS